MSSTVVTVPIGERAFQRLLRIIGVQRGVDDARRDSVESNVLFRVFQSQTSHPAFRPPLVIMESEAGSPAIGLSTNAAVMLTMLPPLLCACICFTASCVM